MTRREARAIAYRNIIDGASADLSNGGEYWVSDPTTKADLSDEDAAKVEREALLIFAALENRARPKGATQQSGTDRKDGNGC